MVYINGERYDGDWKNNRKDGKGIMIFLNGDKYDGEWKNDKMHGVGSYFKVGNETTEIYQGYFEDGYRVVNGVRHKPNGDKLENEEGDSKNANSTYKSTIKQYTQTNTNASSSSR